MCRAGRESVLGVRGLEQMTAGRGMVAHAVIVLSVVLGVGLAVAHALEPRLGSRFSVHYYGSSPKVSSETFKK